MALQLSALQMVNQALQEIGLPQVTTIISGQDDQTGFQMHGLVNALGTQLVRVHDWQFLEKTASFTGDGVKTAFDLPADYGRMVNQTQWADKNKRPMYGPMTPQGWSWVQFGIVSVGVYYRYRIIGNQFHVFPTPPVGETFNFYYISKNWVYDPNTDVYKDRVENEDDLTLFDEYLMVSGIKYKLWSAKGMNATELLSEFNYMLNAEKSQTQGAPVIALDSRWEYLYISGQNVPDGSWNV